MNQMKLTRKHELYLIELGMRALLDSVISPVIKKEPKTKAPSKKWTNAQRAKFKATMKKKFQKDTEEENNG